MVLICISLILVAILTVTVKCASLEPNATLPNCPKRPPDAHGPIPANLYRYSMEAVEDRLHPYISPGGYYKPADCNPKFNIAIIIPFRGRESQLPILLNNLLPMLIRQRVQFRVFLVQQVAAGIFNKGSLLNVAILESLKLEEYDCFIFHDVDLIPLNDHNRYTCPETPKHLSSGVDSYKYKLPYLNLFGGVVAIKREQILTVNGYSNIYWGWGGEDDDLWERIKLLRFGRYPIRSPNHIGRYRMLRHKKSKRGSRQHEKLRFAARRSKYDGLNTVVYHLENTSELPLYTRFLVWFPVKDSGEWPVDGTKPENSTEKAVHV